MNSYRDRLNRIVHEHSSDPMSASQAEAVYTLAWDMAIKLDAAPQVPDTARTGDRPESTTPAAAAPGVRPELGLPPEVMRIVIDRAFSDEAVGMAIRMRYGSTATNSPEAAK